MHDTTQGFSRPGILHWLAQKSRMLGIAAAAAAVLAGATAVSAAPVADPAILLGTFISGDDNVTAWDVKVAPNGDVVVVGDTYGSGLPATSGTYSGNGDGYVARFDSEIGELKWMVYLGTADGDSAMKVAVDSSGDVYVAGFTSSTSFPVTFGAYDTVGDSGGYFVAKLDGDDGSIVWASYLVPGGGLGDFTVDGAGRPIVVGGSPDPFVVRFLADGTDLDIDETYGKVDYEGYALSVAVDGDDDIYVATYGNSYDPPAVENEIFKIDGLSKTVTWTFPIELTPLGASISQTQLKDIAVTSSGVVAFSGEVLGTGLPVNHPWQAHLGGADLFVGKLVVAGDDIDWIEYLGGSGDEYYPWIGLTGDGKIWLSTGTTSEDYPLQQSFFASGPIAVSQLSADGQSLLRSTVFGGSLDLARTPQSLAVGTDSVPVVVGIENDPTQLLLQGLLPSSSEYGNGYVARLEPAGKTGGRFLPRRSVSLPPLDRVIEPIPESFDLDSDGDGDLYIEFSDRPLEFAWSPSVLDRSGDGGDLLAVIIGTIDGEKVLGVLDQDRDGELELVVEDPRLDVGVVQGWLLDTRDQDVDLVVVGRGGASGSLLVDLDHDGDTELVVSSPHLGDGAVKLLDLDQDQDNDVMFIGGVPRAYLDADGDGDLEAIAERGGTPGSVTYGSIESSPDADDDVVFLVGTYQFARDLDDDGIPELIATDGAATAGDIDRVGEVVFVGGQPQLTLDLDGDGELELVATDDTADPGAMAALDVLDGTDVDNDVIFVGEVFRGAFDVDGDGEPELVIEDSEADADTFALTDGIDAGSDDPDVVAVGGVVVAVVNLDDDDEPEIVVESAEQDPGDFLVADGVEGSSDLDADLVFVAGTVAAFADLDLDDEIELVIEESGAASGTFTALDGLESSLDTDADVIFIAGTWRATRDLDEDEELELLSEDSGLGSAATAVNGIDNSPDTDKDVVFVKAPFRALLDLDGDGEPEIVVEDSGVTALTVTRSDVVEASLDGDYDLFRIPTTDGFLVADPDGDGELEFLLAGESAGDTTLLDNADAPSDGDTDIAFVGGIPQLAADIDHDFEMEVIVEAAITPGVVTAELDFETALDDDPDLVYVNGTARGHADLDGDFEEEVVVEAGSAGAVSIAAALEAIPDVDPDVVLVGGLVREFTNVDDDGDLEAIVENSAATLGSSSLGDPDADMDPDVVFMPGQIQGLADFDGDNSDEPVALDSTLAGGSAVDPSWDGDPVGDGVIAGTSASPGSPSLTLSSPNGGGTVTLGDPLSITWTSVDLPGTLRIEISRDGGTNWELLFANTPNDGSETWTSEGDPSTTVKVRITSRNLADAVSDVSAADFTLSL